MTIVNCTTCNNELIRNNSQIKASKTGNFFCDKECRSKWDSIKYDSQKVAVKCLQCSEEFYDVASAAKDRTFCSQKCLSEYRSDMGNTAVKCEYCNKEFKKLNSQLREHNLCSINCRSAWNAINHNRKELECQICNEKYIVSGNRENSSKTCSKECHYKYIKYISTEGHMHEHLREIGIKGCLNGRTSGTKPERMVEEYLKVNNIEYESQKLMHDKFIVDFYLPKYNMVLEVNGDFWHCNPRIYGEGLKVPRDHQIKQKNKDKSRKAYLEKCGYNFKVAWEMDIYKDTNNLLKSIIN